MEVKTILDLSDKTFQSLFNTMKKSIDIHGDKKFDKENLGWRIVYQTDGNIEVWHGKYGLNSKEVD